MKLRDHLARIRVERREQRRRSMPVVVVRAPLHLAQSHRQQWLRGWICGFSSTQNTAAYAGGFKYNPIMLRTFSMSSGSRR
jgi:hypothetical protein